LIKLFFNEKPHSHYFRRDERPTFGRRFVYPRKYDKHQRLHWTLYLLFLTSLVFATRLGTIITIAFPVEVKVFGRETIGPSWRNLPVARNSIEFRAENDRENTIFLNSEGRLIFHDKIITPNQLRTELQASYSSIYKQRLLFVVDATTRMEKVYEILTVCRQSGIRNIIYIVRPFDPETIQMVVE
jgi:hypothetical protein